MHFASNIKLLRKRRKRSQEEIAQSLGIKRSSLSGYENGSSEPNFTTLLAIADFFRMSLDSLLNTDLGALSESRLTEMERGMDIDLTGTKLRILATTVGEDNEENIELVPQKARAGYTSGYADPDFIRVLSTFRMPFLDRSKKYRTFQIAGDSMPPVPEGSWVTGEFLQNWNYIKNGHPYLIVTKEDGIVFKVVYNKIREQQCFLLCSTNPIYEPYEMPVSDVLEIWQFVNYISSEMPEPNLSRDELASTVLGLQREVSQLKNRYKNNHE